MLTFFTEVTLGMLHPSINYTKDNTMSDSINTPRENLEHNSFPISSTESITMVDNQPIVTPETMDFRIPNGEPVRVPVYQPVEFALMSAIDKEFTPKAPLHGSETAGGFDLYVASTKYLAAGQSALIRTGVMMKIPQGWVGIISPRSSVASKQLLRVGARIIDSDYRGEVLINIHNDSQHQAEILTGDRLAQIVFIPHLNQMVQVDILDETARGVGGFGSTGV